MTLSLVEKASAGFGDIAFMADELRIRLQISCEVDLPNSVYAQDLSPCHLFWSFSRKNVCIRSRLISLSSVLELSKKECKDYGGRMGNSLRADPNFYQFL